MFKKLRSFNITFRKYRRAVLPFFIGLVVVLVPLIIFLQRHAKEAEAAWWNDLWLYRQKSTITNSGSAQTDFQISFVIDTATLISAGKMQSDCDDIRVTDATGKLLYHWIEEGNPGCNSSTTKIWTKLASIPTTAQNIYVYYGNPAASNVESGDQIFMFFDNFSTSDLSKWLTLTSGTSSTSVSGGKITLSTSTGNSGAGIVSKNTATPGSTTFVLEEKLNFTSSTGTNIRDRMYLCNNQGTIAGCNRASSFDYGAFSQASGAQPQVYWNAFTGTSITTANEVKITQTLDGSNFSFAMTDLSDNSSIYSNSTAQASTSYNYVFLAATHDAGGTGTSQIAVDWVFTRKYAATAPSAATAASEEQGTGPLGFWKLDEGVDNTCSGGTNDVCDSMGKNDGAISNGTAWRNEDLCVSGKCLEFDGSDDDVSMGSPASLDDLSALSLVAWIRPNTVGEGSSGRIVTKAASVAVTVKGWYWYINSSQKLTFSVSYNNDGSSGRTCTTTDSVELNKWQQVAVTWDGTNACTGMKLYINGVSKTLTQSGSVSGSRDSDASYNFRIGNEEGGARTFDGYIDDVKIYNYVRSAAQISADYAGAGTSKGTTAELGSNSQNLSSSLSNGLAGYWKLDESSGNATDTSGNGNTLTDTNTVARTGGKFYSAGDFERTNSEYFYVADSAALSITGDLTVAAWINREDTGDGYFLNKSDNSDRDSYLFSIVSNKLRLTLVDSSDVSSTTDSIASLSVSTWYHVAGTYNQATRSVALYINGQLAASSTTGTVPSALEDNDGRFHLGATGSSGTPVGYYDGLIDEARVYNRTLTPKEIEALYNWAPGPVVYYKLDEIQGTSGTVDSSGNGLNASFTGIDSATKVPGKYGSALNFDGTNDYMYTADNSLLEPPYDMSLSAWVKFDQLASTKGEDEVIVRKRYTGGSPFQSYILYLRSSDNAIRFEWYNTGGTSYSQNASTTVAINTWYHIEAVKNGTSLYVYVNGVDVSSLSPTTTGTLYNSDNNFEVGAKFGSTARMDGIIDEVKLYNYARSQKQVIEDLNAAHPVGGSPSASQLGYWSLDEQQGQTAYDRGYGVKNLTLGATSSASTDDPSWETPTESKCKVNGCQTFDGSADLNQIGSALLSAASNYSISTWIFPTDVTSVTVYGEGSTGSSTQAMRFGINASSKFQFQLINDADSSISIASATSISASTWTHIAMTKNGSEFKLYINGNLDASSTLTTSGTYTFNSTSVGALKRNTTIEYFAGQIDEVKIYSSALTNDEIKIDYNANSAVNIGVTATQDNEGFSGNPPAGWWKMDENKDNTCVGGTNDVCDTSGNGSDGALTSGAAWTTGKIGSGVGFDGTDDYVTMGDPASGILDIADSADFTVTGWFRIDDFDAAATLVAKKTGNTAGTTGYLILVTSGGKLNAYASDGTDQFFRPSSTTLSAETWYHFAFVYDESDSNNSTFYLNGVEDSGTATGTLANVNSLDNTQPFVIGAESDFGSPFDGKIDNIKFYTYALSKAQIANDFNRGAPLAWYRFDECQGTTAYNAAPTGSGVAAGVNGTITPGGSGNTSAGTCNSGTSTEMWNDGTTGKINSSLGFDGTNDYVTTSDAYDNLFTSTTAQFSIAAWIKPTTLSTGKAIVSKYGDGGCSPAENQRQWMMYITNSDKLTMLFNENTNGTGAEPLIASQKSLSTGVWTHVAAIVDVGADTVSLYINGQLDSTTSLSTAVTEIGDGTTPILIGAYCANGANGNFDGLIDDVRIYSYGLSASQMKTIYNNGAVYFGPTSGSP